MATALSIRGGYQLASLMNQAVAIKSGSNHQRYVQKLALVIIMAKKES